MRRERDVTKDPAVLEAEFHDFVKRAQRDRSKPEGLVYATLALANATMIQAIQVASVRDAVADGLPGPSTRIEVK